MKIHYHPFRPLRTAARPSPRPAVWLLIVLAAGPLAAQEPEQPPAVPSEAAAGAVAEPGEPGSEAATAASTAEAADPDALLAVPQPDLSSLEPAVAAQLAGLAGRIEAIRHAAEDIGPPNEPPRMPEDPEVRAGLAEAFGELALHYHAYSLLAVAEPAYVNAIRLAPGEPRWPHLLGLLLVDAGRLAEAAELFGLALRLSPEDDPALLVHLGEVRRLQGDLAAAKESFTAALAARPDYPSAIAGLGQVALAEGRWQTAAEHLETALAAVPGADLLHYPLAMAYRGLGDLEKAQEHLDRRGVVGLRPADPQLEALAAVKTGERVHRMRGRQALRIGRVDDAVAAFRRALEVNPESVETRVDLAAALAAQDNPTAAIGALREALAAAPDNATARYNLGLLLRHQGDLDAAVVHLRRAVELSPEDAEVLLALADALLERGAATEALELSRRATEAGAATAEAEYVAGRAHLAADDVAAALAAFEAAHAADRGHGLVAHALARILAAAPDPAQRSGERAVELAERVFAAAPTVGHAETLAMALAEAGRCEEAAALQEQAMEGARAGGAEAEAARLGRILAHYRDARPCRPPVSAMHRPASP